MAGRSDPVTEPARSDQGYAAQVLPHVGRALAMLDTVPTSRTYGCFDRAFWYYRTLTNFPGSGWQQLALALTLVHETAVPENLHAGDPRLLDAAVAGLSWWASIQHRDGSFDEWYLNEHSYCPTAFTVAGAASAVLLLGDRLPIDRRAKVVAALERAGRWLARRYNARVMNQNLAAAAGLAAIKAVTGAAEWDRALDEKLLRLTKDQRDEGWFPEYDGCDLGYSTLALDMLARIDALSADPRAVAMAERLSVFLNAMAGGFGAFPGRLGSRGTAHLFPYGAEHFADRIPACAALAAHWRDTHTKGLATGPADVDDRYFAYFHLPQFALAYHRTAG